MKKRVLFILILLLFTIRLGMPTDLVIADELKPEGPSTRIEYYLTGGDSCDPILEPPRFTGQDNIHLYGTYTCHCDGFTMDGTPLPMRTGTFTWTDVKLEMVGGQSITTGKSTLITDEGGVWVGTFLFQNTGSFHLVQHGEGIYKGMHAFEEYNHGVILITK